MGQHPSKSIPKGVFLVCGYLFLLSLIFCYAYSMEFDMNYAQGKEDGMKLFLRVLETELSSSVYVSHLGASRIDSLIKTLKYKLSL